MYIENIFGMANLYPKRTGLPMVFWVDNVGSDRTTKHNLPRIKVQNILGDKRTDDVFSLSISKEPEILAGECKLSSSDLKIIMQYVIDNYDILMQHWNGEIDEDELKEILYNK